MIKLYEWYKDAKQRIWCVVRVWPTGKPEECTIDILELGKSIPVNQPEQTLLNLIKNGHFQKYTRK
ncbi:hypothetical protein [Pedobacter punctiformis]|uniref:Uncharacterized protein n=1 Tax=Pedobacter punctiformis TaxID=3004097 RepID=A0ABT4LAJ6_9SPHI|nr:hypothetical protein [Pedobacter sp. HCMS5-2]MCZ4244941.1 hypothetical protein [Pedobacter sp. HCMS5-2]